MILEKLQLVLLGKGLANLAMLLFSKAGGVLVGIVFLPLYSHLLGINEFSVLVVILSIQGLLLMLDFGMATVVGRELALKNQWLEKVNLYFNAISLLTVIYFCCFVLFLVGCYLFISENYSLVVRYTLAMVFFYFGVLQNIITTALISLQKYKPASVIQGASVFIKAIFSLLILKYVSPSVDAFLIVHCSLGLLHIFILHRCFIGTKLLGSSKRNILFNLAGLKKIAASGQSLFLFGAAGALALQADKLIISHYMSAADVSAYFFAMTFCMTPLAVLGGPISQYFQPKIVALVVEKENEAVLYLVKHFVFVLVGLVLSASLFLLFFREELLRFWLGSFPFVSQVSRYVLILMPGLAIGALGFIPFVLLTSIQDFNFQTRLSMLLTTILMMGVSVSAWANRLEFVCLSYALYHASSTILSWWRTTTLNTIKTYSIYAASLAIGLVFLYFIAFVFLLK